MFHFFVQNIHLKRLFPSFKLNTKTEGSILGEMSIADDVGKERVENKVDGEKFKYASCKDCWTDKRCVVAKQNNHVVYFCLNCNYLVSDKSVVIDQN